MSLINFINPLDESNCQFQVNLVNRLDKRPILTWSCGIDKFDAYPKNFQGTIAEFVVFVDVNRSPYKGKYYITSAIKPRGYRSRGRRCNANAFPRQWLAFDMDGNLCDEDFARLKKRCNPLNCIMYETASSKPNARRCRIILLISRPVIESEAKVIGELVQNTLGFDGWDNSTHRASQPVFLPPVGNELTVFDGELLDVDLWLAKAPPKPIRKPRKLSPIKTKNLFVWFANHDMVLSVGSTMHKVICPWAHLHSDGRNEAALFEPSSANNLVWGFKCLHAHCSGRTIKDIYQLMKGVI